MKEEEYIYDIGKFTNGVDKNGKDEMVLTIAKVENGEIISLFNCYGDNARCINLLIKENKKLKNQISDLECLVESIKLGVTLNQKQEKLLDKILFRSDK